MAPMAAPYPKPMTVDPRHPYSGSLVFAAFSGSHQDAIAKGMKWREEMDPSRWTVPYLPVDPHDVGREYDGDVIRINSQSGKGGVAYIIERDYGFIIPKAMDEAAAIESAVKRFLAAGHRTADLCHDDQNAVTTSEAGQLIADFI